MYLVTHMKVTTERNEDGELEQVVKFDAAHVEQDVDNLLERIRLGDHRTQGVRIFKMGVDQSGEPKIGSEVEP